MKMTILERDDDITHIILTGRLDTTGTNQINEMFTEATSARKRPAMVDLSEIEFLSSTGIGLLFANGKKLMRAGCQMVLVNPQELVAKVLRTSRTEAVMPVARDLGEAVRIVEGVPDAAGKATSPRANAPSETVAERVVPVQPLQAGELTVAISNELTELADLTATLTAFLESHGVPSRATYAVNLAIDELVVNVIRYAYVDDDPHIIDIELTVDVAGEQVILRITDDGRPFDPRNGPVLDLHAEDREVGGLGLILVLDMVDVLHYQRVEEKNCVEVRVHLVEENEGGDLLTGEHSNVP
jgi:serine/threonine-protein kinase RsbW